MVKLLSNLAKRFGITIMVIGNSKELLVIVPVSAPMAHYFLVDHPFIFMLKSGATHLFNGKVELPVSGDNVKAPVGTPVKDPFSHNIHIKLK